ncbi:MAG: methyltransferase domain-containing protein [bacterium]|nr:methyltransferase domain-containing protein [bacterium]
MMIEHIKYYFGASYQRKAIDALLEQHAHYYKGVVLDIGGRGRGKFQKPKDTVERWIFADIEPKHHPDIVLDVANMGGIKNGSIDVINAIELFEHVENPEKGLLECHRVLKDGGIMIASVPFLFPVHADPYDFQRWTDKKWESELAKAGFTVQKLEIMGRYFTVMMEMAKVLTRQLPFGIHYLSMAAYPLFDLLAALDKSRYVLHNNKLANYHQGYFIICKKT